MDTNDYKLETELKIIQETQARYCIIEKYCQQAVDDSQGNKKLYISPFLWPLLVVLVCFGIIFYVLFNHVSRVSVACQPSTLTNSDRQSKNIVSCEIKQIYLLNTLDRIILPATPIQNIFLEPQGESCRIKLVTADGGVTREDNAQICSLEDEVQELNHNIETMLSAKQVDNQALAYEKDSFNIMPGYAFNPHRINIVISLLLFIIVCWTIYTTIKTGNLMRVEFDKQLRTVTFWYITPFKTYSVVYNFDDVKDIYIKEEVDDDGETVVRKHQLLTTDNKKHPLISLPITQARVVHNRIREILGLPASN